MAVHLPGPRSWSIRARLLLLVLSVWLPAVVAFALLARTTYEREEAAARGQMREDAESLNAAVEAELDKRAVLARTLAASLALRDGDVERFHQEAARASQDSASWVFLVDRSHQLANTLLPHAQPLPRAEQEPFVESGAPGVFFSAHGTVMRQPQLAVYAPELHGLPPRFNVGVSLDPRVVQDVLARYQQLQSTEAVLSVVDKQHLVIARSRDPGKWLGVEATGVMKARLLQPLAGFGASTTLDGVSSLSYISSPNRYGWRSVTALPLASLQRTAQQLTAQATLAAGALLLIGLAIALYAGRRIAQPLGALKHAAAALGRNEVPPCARSGLEEVDAVNAAMHDAGVRLEASGREMQQRVSEAVQGAEQARTRLLESQKHEAIGRLTGGIAHDFNNLLQTITMGLHLVERSVPTGRHSRAVTSALNASTKAADLVRQMLTFGRSQPLRPEPVDVRDFLLKNQELTRKAVGERVHLVAHVDIGVRAVHVDATQLELALLNLIFNARDAMPHGGSIQVRARAATSAESDRLPAGDYACLEVQDDGPGIPIELQAKVFDPYFTTKPVGAGSGLGLAQVLGFARQSGGDVRLASSPGQGTCITLLLPACEAVPVAGRIHGTVAAHRQLRILMVEDDVLVSSVVVPALEAEGHDVTLCASGDEAQEFLQDGWRFDLLFTDVVMPGGLGGLELAAWCRARMPELGVVVTTGYTAEQIEPSLAVLRKPYAMAELLAALQAAAVDAAPAAN
ncbi:MAG TPA: ATP-binding protein [Ramlibacter sp.]|uniref:ATP-binding protein n=1 Tax=Ramlibacter sp. TaxID=1917967 RepID=UPI002ED1DDAF